MNCARYELVEFGGDLPDDRNAADLAQLHTQLLSHSPLVLMGPEFMRKFYYTLLPAGGFISGAIAYIDDKPAGFIVATNDADGFMSKATKKYAVRLAGILFQSLLRRPSRLAAMKEAYDIQSHVQAQDYGSEVGELLSFGVLPEYRSRSFVKMTGFYIGVDLLGIAVKQMKAAGKKSLRAIVDKDNLEAQIFYRSNGWRVGLQSVEGWRVPTMEFLCELN